MLNNIFCGSSGKYLNAIGGNDIAGLYLDKLPTCETLLTKSHFGQDRILNAVDHRQKISKKREATESV
jgi:hypothetical protein